MIKVSSKVKLNLPKIRKLTQIQIAALKETADALREEVAQAQVIPMDTGNLQNESFFVDCSESSLGKVTLVHNTPYARRLYFHPEYKFSKVENPNAKGKWFSDWEEGGVHQDFAIEAYKKIYRRLTGV